LDFISLVAPTSKDRIKTIAGEAEGFVYCVSSLGVTGVRSQITTDVEAMVHFIRNATDLPVAIGFGISTPEQAADMAAKSDGVIIGSAIMKILEQYGFDSVPYVSDYIRGIKTKLCEDTTLQ
jgi:tryptophan synthase alpha chain